MPLRLDFTNMMDSAVTGGLGADEWRQAAAAFNDAHRAVDEAHHAGTLGFLDLPESVEVGAAVVRFADETRAWATDAVVLGIGGSALGPIALRTSLASPSWNELDDAARGGRPRLHVLQNVDPRTIAELLGRLDLARTMFVVTSKSGGTAETMAQYLVIRARLDSAGLPPARHFVFITDPERGALRALARAESIPAFDVPANVGGRFSVLTPVGLLPAALLGIDVHALLAGAGAIRDRCATSDLFRNPAGCFAVLQWLATERRGRHVHVLMPYDDRLRDIALWFVQLWAESLGKVRPDGSHTGPTPLAALGATDQHSQVQLFMEGPHDKTVTVIAIDARDDDLDIPALHSDVPELAYLGGHSLGELLDAERQATTGALARRGRPSMTVYLPRVDAHHLGELMMLFEIATAYAGALFGVDAFDQPGVELGKQFTYAVLGRADASAAAATEWEQLPPPDPRWSV